MLACCYSLSLLALAACGGGGRAAVVPAANVAANNGIAPNDATSVADATVRATGTAETARAADGFVDSVGLNVHLGYYGTPYGDNFTAINSLLAGLGVRHVRDGVYPGQTNLCANFRQLASSGIHADFIVAQWMSTTDVTTWDSCTGRTGDAYEGLNEWDISHPASDQNWAQTDGSVQKWLYSTAKAMRRVTVVAPSLTSESAYASVGSLATVSDVGNTHVYFAGRNPGTSGWGAGGPFGVYGSLGYDVAIARQSTGTKPMYATESGYGDWQGTWYAVPAATKSRYVMRTLLESWNARVARTYIYELVDEGGGDFGSYGLTDGNAAPKPAYVALKNLLAHLRDPGASFTPGSLAYTLAGPTQLHHALFQKRNKSFVLALWLEGPEWDPSSNSAVAFAPQSVRVTFGRAPSALHTTSFDDAGNVSTNTVASGTVLSLPIGGSPVLVDVTP